MYIPSESTTIPKKLNQVQNLVYNAILMSTILKNILYENTNIIDVYTVILIAANPAGIPDELKIS